MRLQEGVLLDNVLDIKGLQIRKSNVNKHTRKELQSILEDTILRTKDIKLNSVINRLVSLEDKIRDSFLKGEIDFCSPGNSKTADEYSDAMSQANYRAACLYNIFYKDQPIILPESFNTVRLKITEKDDPNLINIQEIFGMDVYNEVIEFLFKVNDKGKYLSKYQTNLIALPKSLTQIPEWIIPLIDIDEILKNNLSTFLPLYSSVGGKTVQYTAKDKFITNIIL